MVQYKPLQTAKIKTPWTHIEVWNHKFWPSKVSPLVYRVPSNFIPVLSLKVLTHAAEIGSFRYYTLPNTGLSPALPLSPFCLHQHSPFFTVFSMRIVIKSMCTVQAGQVLSQTYHLYNSLPPWAEQVRRVKRPWVLGWGYPLHVEGNISNG